MRTRIDFIADGIRGNLGEPGTDEGAGTDVLVTWNEYPAGTTIDPTSGTVQGTPTVCQETIKAFVHFVGPASSMVRQFTEIETGDCILEYDPGVCLEGRRDARFVINGQTWSVKPISDRLKETWDATFAGRQLFKTLLLRRAT